MHIVFDINGNDKGPQAGYNAAYEFCLKNPNDKITLIGEISLLKQNENLENLFLIENNLKVANPKNIRENLKMPTSMNEAIDMVKNSKADAILSSGDSASYVAGLTLTVGRIPNLSRPTFMPVANTINGQKLLILDVGSNTEVKPEYLYQWALIAKVFYQKMFNFSDPKVTILNIGSEAIKALEFLLEAAKLISKDDSLNYIGFSETREVLYGDYQIALIDGYGGNLVLKSYEGAFNTFKHLLKDGISKSFRAKLGALLLKPAFENISKVLDYKKVGAAWVFGINTLAIKTHGASDIVSYLYALEELKNGYKSNFLDVIRKTLKEN